MRMGVVFGRLAVGGPAGMADTDVARERFCAEARLEVLQLARGATPIELVALERRDAGGIVAAIFQAFERIHQQLRDRSASQNANNAAHADQYPQIVESLNR